MNTPRDAECYACSRPLAAGAECEGAEVGGEWSYLCPSCWGKVSRGGRTPAQVIEAILMTYSDDFDGPECDADHEDYRDLELLGLWPDADPAFEFTTEHAMSSYGIPVLVFEGEAYGPGDIYHGRPMAAHVITALAAGADSETMDAARKWMSASPEWAAQFDALMADRA